MKQCTLCKEEKSYNLFRTRVRNGKSSFRSHCKSCESKDQVKRARRRMEKDPKFKAESLERVKKWGEENKDRRQKADTCRRRNKYNEDETYRSKQVAAAASYRSQRLSAKPEWLSEEDLRKIDTIYRTCSKISNRTGKPHDVDHIVPLKGKDICGLHVPWNLTILPASMNRSKGNSFSGSHNPNLNP